MQTDGQIRNTFHDRLGASAAGMSLITGQETLEELHRLIIDISLARSTSADHRECPFRIMGTLSHASLTALVSSLPRKVCEDLFRMELQSRLQANSLRPSKDPQDVNYVSRNTP